MNKLRLRLAVYACVIALAFVSASPKTAAAFVNNASTYGSQDAHVSSMAIGANQVKHKGNDSVATGLRGAVFGLSCGLIGVFLLRMSNKR